MRRLVYELANGTVVNTLAEAQESGQTYASKLEEIKSEKPELSPIAEAMVDRFGFVSPKFLDLLTI